MTNTTIQQAINSHSAKTVYHAADQRMRGNHGPLNALGLSAKTLGDALRIQSEAYRQIGEAAQVIDYAQSTAALQCIA